MFYRFQDDVETLGNRASLQYPAYDIIDNEQELSRFELTNYSQLFNTIELTRGSREVDVISDYSTGGAGYVVSAKMKRLLEEVELPPHKFFELEFKNKKMDAPSKGVYYFFQYVYEDNYHWIDFNRSKFYLREEIGDRREEVEFSNPEDLKTALDMAFDRDMRVMFDHISFNVEYSNVDFFCLYRVENYPIITDRFKKKLEAEDTSGLEPLTELSISKAKA